jgi:putative transposase
VPQKQAEQKGKIEDGRLLPNELHTSISISPKYAISHVIGPIKGRSFIYLAGVHGGSERNFIATQQPL